MAVRLKLDSLTDQQKKIIREKLYFQPAKTNFAVNKFVSQEEDPILFYLLDKSTNEIILPYTFANSLMGRHINSQLEYPKGQFYFTGKLRTPQVPVAEKALDQLLNHGAVILNLPTGFGKSAISSYLSAQLSSQPFCGITLILTNRQTIQTGWVETFKQNTTAVVWVIENKIKIPERCNVIISMDGRVNKIPKEILKMVSILVIDEAHLFCTRSQVPVLLATCPKYIIANSATMERKDNLHVMITSILGNNKVEVKNEKSFTVYKVMTGIDTELVKNKMGTVDFSKLTASLANNEIRNRFIVDLIEKNLNQKIMLLTWSKKHVEILYNALKARGISVDYLTGNKSKYIDSTVLLGTISKVSTGFDSKNVAINFDGMDISMMIFLASTKSFNLHIQSIGRAFRSENPIIFDIVDEDRISKSHYNERRKNYENMNCKIYEVSVTNVFRDNIQTQENSLEMHLSRVEIHKEKMKNKITSNNS